MSLGPDCPLGDEMGLGKTIQALAVMSDLVVVGQTPFLVVCPASLRANWAREVESRTTLTADRLHGDDREEAIKAWAADGGVGLTTFETLTHVPTDGSVEEVGLVVVVDEAHYVKNPRTRRARPSRRGRGSCGESCSSPGRRWTTGSRTSLRS
ncbi:SNF2-related protein [Luteimicrobium sp. NPDC057192]|uniref:SNF2-related protein n=1 Tax=Luteimicrobium sp. NPDC057192 TaxID=3346042 RepID=UPI003633A51A